MGYIQEITQVFQSLEPRDDVTSLLTSLSSPSSSTSAPNFLSILKDALAGNETLLNDVFWDLVPCLFASIDELHDQHDIDVVQQLIVYIAKTCSAKEVMLVLDDILISCDILVEANEDQKNLTSKKVISILVLKEAILRITRRNAFMSRLQEIVLRMVQSVAKSSQENTQEEEEEGEERTSEARVQIINENAGPIQTNKEEEDKVIPAVIDLIVAVTEDIAKQVLQVEERMKENKGGENSEDERRTWKDVCKQRKQIVGLVFVLLAEPVLVARPSQNGPAQLTLCIIILKVPFMSVLEHNQGIDKTAGSEPVSELESEKVLAGEKWPHAGLGHFVYCLIIQHSHLVSLFPPNAPYMVNYYPCVISPAYTFNNMHTCIINLIQQAHSGTKGLHLAKCIVKTIPPASHVCHPITNQEHWGLGPTDDSHPQFSFFKELITWTIQCDDARARTKAHHLFQAYMSTFDASSRFSLLSSLLPSPFSASSALFIHRLKQEIDNAYHGNKYGDNSTAYFVSSKVIELFPLFMHAGGNIMDRMDELIAGLNLFRYLLIKDRSDNKTGIWSSSQISAAQGQFIRPLKDKLDQLEKQFANPNPDFNKNSEILGLPQLSPEEYQQAARMASTSVLLLTDLVNRVDEILESEL